MKDREKISILMPAKNSERFLMKTLDSIVAQTDDNWELIVVNDGSTDGTTGIIKEYAENDYRIRIFDNEEGGGIIPALRTAFKHSRGELITRMDSDDLMAPEKLETMRNLLDTHGPGHIATGMVKCFSDSGIREGYQIYEDWLNGVILSEDPYSEIYRECVIQSSCWMVYRNDLIKAGSFDHDTYPEDYDLCFRFRGNQDYKGKPLASLKPVADREAKILHYWRDHPARVSRNSPEYADQQFFDLKLKYFFEQDRDTGKELFVWGTGSKGKKLVSKIQKQYTVPLRWIGNNPKKIGETIYDIKVENSGILDSIKDYQVIIAVSGPDDIKEIEEYFKHSGLIQNINYFYFC